MKLSNRLARQRARTIQRRTLTRTRRRNRLVAGRCHPRKRTVANNPGHKPDRTTGLGKVGEPVQLSILPHL